MSFHKDWEGLAARIDGLHEASRLYFESIPMVGSDYHGVSGSYIIPAIRATFCDLRRFLDSYQKVLPVHATEALSKFLAEAQSFESQGTITGIPGVQGMIIPLSVFRAQFDRLIHDAPTHAKNLIIRAFNHLQRMIVADKSARQLWKSAFDEGEPSCERLGATHFLMHGIWAFKASAEGERTDLVLGGPLHITPEIEASAEALVLTEWKRLVSRDDINSKIAEALAQLRRYSESILAGFELADDRYIILVSHDFVGGLHNIHENNITYHCVNIAVDPSVPSMLARKS